MKNCSLGLRVPGSNPIKGIFQARAQAARASTSLKCCCCSFCFTFCQIGVFFSEIFKILRFSKFLDFQTFIIFARAFSLKSLLPK